MWGKGRIRYPGQDAEVAISMTPSEPTRWQWNPALRTSAQSRDGQALVVVHDPVSGEYFEIGSTEHAIAVAFDGRRTVGEVAALRAAVGEPVTAEDLAEFVDQLCAAGMLVPADGTPSPVSRAVTRRTWGERLLHIQIAATRPAPFFAATMGWVRPLLGRPALAAAALLFGAGAWISIGHGVELRQSLGGVFEPGGLLLFWCSYAVIVLVHELAHGYVCTAFGGSVQSLGFVLMWGKPCAYCDVSDAWLLGKSQRLRVMAAGAAVELVLWALSTVAWRVTAPETWMHRAALVPMLLCGLGTLVNLNPLLRFDGYYMLSDWLEIPNLRSRAFGMLGAVLTRQPAPPATPRERRIFLAYGVFAVVYSAAVLGFVLVQLTAWIGARWGTAGTALLWGGVLAVAAKSGSGMWGRVRAAVAASAVRRRMWWAGGTLLAIVALAGVRWPLHVAAESRLEPRQRVVVHSPVGAPVESIYVREGEWVEAGGRLGRLATRDLDFALQHARAQVDELDARLALLERGPRPQEIDMAGRRVAAATTRLEYAQRTEQRARESAGGGLVSRQAAETAEREVRLAEEEQTQAKRELELLQAGARPEELAAMHAQRAAVRAEASRLEDERGRTEVLAPIAGHVLSPHPEHLVGRVAERGDSLLVLADTRTLVVEIPVSEKDVADVALGALVQFKSRTLPNRLFEGRVVEIAPAADLGERQHVVRVKSEIPNPEALLRPGTSGFAKIRCGTRPLGVLLARRAVRTLRTEFWAIW